MNDLPEIKKVENGVIWNYCFKNFKAKIYVPDSTKNLLDDILNYGFIAPYLIVFPENELSDENAITFAKQKGLEKVASLFSSSVVFVTPVTNNWETASSQILSELITNTRIHQYYENGVVRAWNRFAQKLDGYFIRGAIFRICLFGFGKSADFIARNYLKHFEGDGLWGRSDLAPTSCYLTNLSVNPEIEADDIPVVSYKNSNEINKLFEAKCKYFVSKNEPDFETDLMNFSRFFRRMVGPLDIDPDLQKDGLIREPGVATVNTSSDNFGDDKGTQTHKIGYFAFYNKDLFKNGPVPLVLGFHGGGDSALSFSISTNWSGIAARNNFLLVCVENHLNSSATETVELIHKLKEKYPIDESRIYATGFSMGGIKTWDLIQEYPQILAAAAPMGATVDLGENVYFRKIDKPINEDVPVPTFYAAGEITPLAEMPCQEQKCINRMAYSLKINNVLTHYEVKLDEKAKWENRFWGINGDIQEKSFDPKRGSTLTMEKFKNKDGEILNIFASVSEQGHDCREHTCQHAWDFMKQFKR